MSKVWPPTCHLPSLYFWIRPTSIGEMALRSKVAQGFKVAVTLTTVKNHELQNILARAKTIILKSRLCSLYFWIRPTSIGEMALRSKVAQGFKVAVTLTTVKNHELQNILARAKTIILKSRLCSLYSYKNVSKQTNLWVVVS